MSKNHKKQILRKAKITTFADFLFSMKKIIVITLVLFTARLSAQVSIKDSSIYTPMIGISYGYQFPGGDLVRRFGSNSSVGLNIDFKSQSYFMLGINGNYLFGNTIKEPMFANLTTPEGYIINRDGGIADVRCYERGFTVSGTIGRMFPFKKPNPNTGIVANLGFGFIQHKIRIETIGNNVPQLDKENKKGYDRLTNGFLLSQNLGYLYLSNNRLANIYFGLECMEGFTQSRRSYDYDLMSQDTQKRIDILYGGRIMWILPLYKKPPSAFYTH